MHDDVRIYDVWILSAKNLHINLNDTTQRVKIWATFLILLYKIFIINISLNDFNALNLHSAKVWYYNNPSALTLSPFLSYPCVLFLLLRHHPYVLLYFKLEIFKRVFWMQFFVIDFFTFFSQFIFLDVKKASIAIKI